MSISAMKQAYAVPLIEQLESVPADARMMYEHDKSHHENIPVGRLCREAAEALRQAIEKAEKQEPVAVKHMMDWVYQLKRFSNDGRYMNIPSGLSAGACYELAVEIEQFIKTEPVHAIDISQERVDETAKDHHGACVTCGALIEDQIIQPPFTLKFDAKGKPQREWVGLTDGEMVDLLKECEGRLWSDGFRAIEAKLKEKNT